MLFDCWRVDVEPEEDLGLIEAQTEWDARDRLRDHYPELPYDDDDAISVEPLE